MECGYCGGVGDEEPGPVEVGGLRVVADGVERSVGQQVGEAQRRRRQERQRQLRQKYNDDA